MTDNTIAPVIWKSLNESAEMEFKQHARGHYQPGAPVNMLWHPVYLFECYQINKEAGILKEE